jgi:hypothetical protein
MLGESTEVDVKRSYDRYTLTKLTYFGACQVLVAYGHDDKPPGFIKSGVFLNYRLSAFRKWLCSMETVILKVTRF